MRCAFCDSDLGVSQERDAQGRPFYCCGYCWAHMLHGGIVPDDVSMLIQKMNTRGNIMEQKLAEHDKQKLVKWLIARFEYTSDEEKERLFGLLLDHIEPTFLMALMFAFEMKGE